VESEAGADTLLPDTSPDSETTSDTSPSLDAASGNCIGQIQSNGYVFGAAPACSECNDHGATQADKCTGMIDCLATIWPCTVGTTCWYNCLNSVGGSGVVADCVSALTNAACSH